jgi:predicted DNA-binding transcriptional regulator AlpA
MTDNLDLVGIPEIAERLGVARRTVVAWRYRHRRRPVKRPWLPFPEPFSLGGRPVWQWTDIERWAQATGRLNGR